MSNDEPHVGHPQHFTSTLSSSVSLSVKLKLHSSSSLPLFVFDTQIEVLIHTFVHTISLPSKEMGWESIEGELSTPLVAKEEHHQLYGSGTSSGDLWPCLCQTIGCDDGGESQSGSSSATGVVMLSTLVAVPGSYVFGTAVSEILL